MRPLYGIEEYAWLPELFALLGHEKLIDLCKYAGGEIIHIPTLEQLSLSVESLQSFYDVYIKKVKCIEEVPESHIHLVNKIKSIYDVREYSEIY